MPRRSRPVVESLEGKALLSGLVATLTTDQASYTPGQPVHFTLTETNTGPGTVNFAYGPSNDDFSVTEGAERVWDTNYDAVVPFFLIEATLKPGQSIQVKGIWDGIQDEGAPASPTGTFVVHDSLAPGASATFTIGGSSTPKFALDPLASPVTPPAGPSSVVGTGAAAEVNGLYRTILGRDVDPAGLAAAVSAVRGGTTAAGIASGLTHSAEYRADVVEAEYAAYLGRPASPAEVATASTALKSGLSAGGLAAGLLGSAEFSQDHATDGDFVGSAYRATLGRPASPAEETAVAGLMSAGLSRQAVIDSLLDSPEADTWAVDSLYRTLLGRASDPAGLSSSVAALKAGAGLDSIAAGLIGSSEFAARAAG